MLTSASEAKRDLSDVNWSAVAYDLKDVNWSTVKYNQPGQSTPTPAPAAASQPASQPSAKAQQAAPASTSAAAAPQIAQVASVANTLVTDLTQGVSAIAKALGAMAGKNDQSNNGQIWVGSDSQWKATFTNAANEDAVLYCWGKSSGYSGPFIGSNQPLIGVGVPKGKSITLSWAGNYGSACVPAFASTAMSQYGYVSNSWFEVTFPGGTGTGGFDISRLPNMNGRSIVAQGSQCKSDLNTCVFKCTGDGVTSCTTGYDLFGCGAGTGGGGGYDAAMGGTGGGCGMSQTAENIQVSFS